MHLHFQIYDAVADFQHAAAAAFAVGGQYAHGPARQFMDFATRGDAVVRAGSLEDVFVMLTGEEAE